MSAEYEQDDPLAVAYDFGWVDAWAGYPPRVVGNVDRQRAYDQGYALAERERSRREWAEVPPPPAVQPAPDGLLVRFMAWLCPKLGLMK